MRQELERLRRSNSLDLKKEMADQRAVQRKTKELEEELSRTRRKVAILESDKVREEGAVQRCVANAFFFRSPVSLPAHRRRSWRRTTSATRTPSPGRVALPRSLPRRQLVMMIFMLGRCLPS